MTQSANPQQILEQLTRVARRPSRPQAFMQTHQAAILAALRAGHPGSDLYRALAAAGHPPPMSLRQFRRYLARLRQVPTAAPASIASAPARPASPPATFHWDPLAVDEDIQ